MPPRRKNLLQDAMGTLGDALGEVRHVDRLNDRGGISERQIIARQKLRIAALDALLVLEKKVDKQEISPDIFNALSRARAPPVYPTIHIPHPVIFFPSDGPYQIDKLSLREGAAVVGFYMVGSNFTAALCLIDRISLDLRPALCEKYRQIRARSVVDQLRQLRLTAHGTDMHLDAADAADLRLSAEGAAQLSNSDRQSVERRIRFHLVEVEFSGDPDALVDESDDADGGSDGERVRVDDDRATKGPLPLFLRSRFTLVATPSAEHAVAIDGLFPILDPLTNGVCLQMPAGARCYALWPGTTTFYLGTVKAEATRETSFHAVVTFDSDASSRRADQFVYAAFVVPLGAAPGARRRQ